MKPTEPDELNGKTITAVRVYHDVIEIEFLGEATTAEIKQYDGEVRLEVRAAPGSGSSTAPTRVYRSDFPRP